MKKTLTFRLLIIVMILLCLIAITFIFARVFIALFWIVVCVKFLQKEDKWIKHLFNKIK